MQRELANRRGQRILVKIGINSSIFHRNYTEKPSLFCSFEYHSSGWMDVGPGPAWGVARSSVSCLKGVEMLWCRDLSKSSVRTLAGSTLHAHSFTFPGISFLSSFTLLPPHVWIKGGRRTGLLRRGLLSRVGAEDKADASSVGGRRVWPGHAHWRGWAWPACCTRRGREVAPTPGLRGHRLATVNSRTVSWCKSRKTTCKAIRIHPAESLRSCEPHGTENRMILR